MAVTQIYFKLITKKNYLTIMYYNVFIYISIINNNLLLYYLNYSLINLPYLTRFSILFIKKLIRTD